MNRTHRLGIGTVVAIAGWLLAASHAPAADWVGGFLPAPPGNGSYSFNDTDYWDPPSGSPPSGTNIMFYGDESGTPAGMAIPDGSVFTVYLENNTSNAYNRWNNGHFTMTLDLAGYTETRTSTTAGATFIQGRAQVGNPGDPDYVPVGNITVNLTSTAAGGVANWGTLGVGYAARGEGEATLNVVGPNTTLNITHNDSGDQFRVGSAGIGTMNVTGGATVNSTSELRVGRNNRGTITMTDASTLTVTNRHIYVGSASDGFLTVSGGSRFGNTGSARHIFLAASAGSSSTTVIEGANSRMTTTGRVAIGGISATHTGDRVANVTVRDGGYIQSGVEMLIMNASTLAVQGLASGGGAAVRAGTFMTAFDGSQFAFSLTGASTSPLATAGGLLTLEGDTSYGGVGLDITTDQLVDPQVNDVFVLLQYGTLDGTFSSITTPAGWDFDIDYAYGASDNQVALTLTMIPEPGVAGLLLVAAGLLATCRRRSRG